MAKKINQATRDKQRVTYRLDWPSELDPERVTAWLRSLSGTLRTKNNLDILASQPTIVMEVWGNNQGIQHRLKVPWQYEPYIRPKLESLIPGMRLVKEDEPQVRVWVHAVEVGLKNGHRPLRIANQADLSTSILSNFSTLAEGETLMMQWVLSPAVPEHKPIHGDATSRENSLWSMLTGSTASKDEISDRRDKLDEPNMLTVLRVGAVAHTSTRAQFMVRGIMSSLEAVRGPAHQFYRRMVSKDELQRRITVGATPLTMPVQLTAPELTATIGWPLLNPMVSGLPSAISRRLPAPASVPSTGIVLGQSNYSGRERKLAIGFKEALTHQWIVGPPGVGKSALLGNEFKQIVDAGYGAIVIESKSDLYKLALDYIPARRRDDVICLDVNETRQVIGFNILRQGDPAIIIDELLNLFNSLYRDTGSIWFPEVLYNGLHTLVGDKRAAFTDLASLVSPARDEVAWRDELIRNVQDPQVRSFWQRFDNQPRARQDQIAAPVLSRVWQLSRSKLLPIVGQSESSFDIRDVVRNNKILLVNLSGVERDTASLMGTLIVNALWQAVKASPMPHSPNYLILDEAHHYAKLPVDLEMMLVEARSMGLGLVFAHQHLDQLPHEMKQALMHSAQTKLVFQTGGDDARDFSRLMGNEISDDDFVRLGKYEAIVRIATQEGVSRALTLNTLAPALPYGDADKVVYASRGRYGRDRDQVMQEIMSRRSTGQNPRKTRPAPDVSGWGNL